MTGQPKLDQAADRAATDPNVLEVAYVSASSPQALLASDDTLAVFGFGAAPGHDDPRYLRVPLQAHGPAPFEVWRTRAPVTRGRDGDIAWASSGRLGFGSIEVEEPAAGIEQASALAYARIGEFLRGSATPHLLRVWNQIDAITRGDGDAERYRQFCVGRVRGIGGIDVSTLPAATAIGREDGVRVLQVYWLAASEPGVAVENPRQVSAYRYPRQYGIQSPSFARAMLPPAGYEIPLLLSGTAAIVGHASRHEGELLTQLDEIFANLDALLTHARARRPSLPPRFGAGTLLKVYVRDRADLAPVSEALQARFGDEVPRIVLHAAVCRRELCVEIEGMHGGG